MYSPIGRNKSPPASDDRLTVTDKRSRRVSEGVEQTNADFEALMRDIAERERDGSVDEATERQFEMRFKEISGRLDQVVKGHVADITSPESLSKPQSIDRRFFAMSLAMLVVALAGLILDATIGNRFIFAFSNEYRAAMPSIFVVWLTIWAGALIALERTTHALRAQHPNRMERWFVVFPILAACTAAMFTAAPLGWSAFLGWGTGTPTSGLTARMVSMDEPSPSAKGCRQRADVAFKDVSARVCLEGRIVGPLPEDGDALAVSGRLSSLGLYIDEVRRAEMQKARQ